MTRPAPNLPDPSTDPRPTPSKTRTGGKRVTRRLIVMSSAAILAVYAAGYFKTESAADQVAAQQAPPPANIPAVATPTTSADSPFLAQAPIASPTPVPTAVEAQIARARGEDDDSETASAPTAPVPTATSVPPTVAAPKTTTTAPKPTATPTSRYRDGKYTGTGSSRHGDVQATVVVKGGKIVSANIDGCMTRYPCSVIRDLPGEVVQQQTANVDFISGASDSSSAYQEAVANALSQAQAT